MSSTKAPIIEEIVDQYFDEAAYLWSQRDAAVTASNYTLSDLTFLDERVEAHIDGLRIAGDHGWDLCKNGLDPADPGTVFTTTIIACESGNKDRIKLVVNAGSESHAAFRAMVSGAGWMDTRHFNTLIKELVVHKSRRHRRLGIAVCGIRRINPRAYLDQAINSSDLFLKATALNTAGEIKRLDLLPQLREHFQHEDHGCRFAAAKSALLLGDRSALDTLGTFVLSGSEFTMTALQFALPLVDGQIARNWLKTLAKNPEQRRTMLIAVGLSGDPVYLPMLLKQMGNPEYARIAGQSFSSITGADLVLNKFDTEQPETFQAGPNDNPDDEDVEMDVDEDLPWPDAERVTDWWQQNSASFPSGARYLSGSPVSRESCLQVLNSGTQQQRQAAALELALSSPEAVFVNTKAPGFRQKAGF